MEIIGYSERGMLNSLFYEIAYSQNDLQLLNEFLKSIYFPYKAINFQISEAKLLIEQSFSDFGDADAVLLLNNQGNNQIAFIEAKVKTSQRKRWNISEEFGEFTKGIAENNINSSNLFVQLYHKVSLIKALQDGDIKQVQNGVQFPKGSAKKNRKIGENKVVLKAVNLLVPYCSDALFIAIVPDNNSSIKAFYQDTLKDYKPSGFQYWNIMNWGFISWEDVESFCKKHGLSRTIENFCFNKGQIYDENQGNS